MAIVRDVTENAADLAEKLGRLLLSRGWTLAVAESCTGGLIGHYVTNVSGSSGYFEGGIISYANRIKQDVVGVPEALLIEYGAVSAPVAAAMARGVRRRIGADVAIAVTGIAGPTGGTPEKPVGTVFVAAATPDGEAVRHCLWDSDREGNKQLSAAAAMALAVDLLESRAG